MPKDMETREGKSTPLPNRSSKWPYLANLLTLGRIVAAPAILALWLSGYDVAKLMATLLFAAAALTDYLDGVVARRISSVSLLGEFLDPVADKFLVATASVVVAVTWNHPLITTLVTLTLMRELLVSALREWVARLQRSDIARVSTLGKYKTTLQLTGLGMLMAAGWQELWARPLIFLLGTLILGISTGLALLSMSSYIARATHTLAQPTALGPRRNNDANSS